MEPVNREALAEAMRGGFLGQIEKLFGVDGSDGARKSWGHADMIPRAAAGGRAGQWTPPNPGEGDDARLDLSIAASTSRSRRPQKNREWLAQ
ncbi:hypothetical protein AB0A70_27280 [Streptomyces morookaense]|uniref:hypothetical protein n=1 Tax=Streptomyces morookaense TaxID=1970 RepID=UPI0033CCF020